MERLLKLSKNASALSEHLHQLSFQDKVNLEAIAAAREHLKTSLMENVKVVSFATALATLLVTIASRSSSIRSIMLFAWNCFLKPVRGATQAQKLESFYAGQADVYDDTRGYLLKGRETMLQLVATHLKTREIEDRAKTTQTPKKRRVWVDIGGGTGWNVEHMDDYLPISTFDAVYVIDLCKPLLEVAEKRFARKGWKNVHCLHQDASKFSLPEWSSDLEEGSISLVTMSYSLSMIPTFKETLDRVCKALDPSGYLGVVDFYATNDTKGPCFDKVNGTLNLKTGAFATWFWTTWFKMDHVHLNMARRDYLQTHFSLQKVFNGRNKFLRSSLIKIPYYIFLGTPPQSASASVTSSPPLPVPGLHGVRMENGLMTPDSPWQKKSNGNNSSSFDMLELGDSAWEGAQVRQSLATSNMSKWRLPYEESHIHKQFRTHIYGWTWEDPDCDVKKLEIKNGDSILAITSAGDNVLHYAAKADVAVHSVDMNPCQGHILELKLAAIRALEYPDFWKIFGEGCHPKFEKLLNTKIAPYLSPQAYSYWQTNIEEFSSNFFLRGYSGWAIRLARVAFLLGGVRGDVKRFINASTTAEQQKIYATRLRPIILNRVMKLILASPFFCWNALGVPINQLNCLLEDGNIEDFITATLDPVPGEAVLKTGAYHYFLCLNGKYTRSSCPLYLTYDGFQALKAQAAKRTDKITMHTETILNVLRSLPAQSLTKIIVMDSLDWFTPIPDSTPLPATLAEPPHVSGSTSPEEEYEQLKAELDYEILEMKRVLKVGGHAIWRSAGKYPWYRRRFEMAGFEIEAIDIREDGKAIDRVNMYASLWRATRVN